MVTRLEHRDEICAAILAMLPSRSEIIYDIWSMSYRVAVRLVDQSSVEFGIHGENLRMSRDAEEMVQHLRQETESIIERVRAMNLELANAASSTQSDRARGGTVSVVHHHHPQVRGYPAQSWHSPAGESWVFGAHPYPGGVDAATPPPEPPVEPSGLPSLAFQGRRRVILRREEDAPSTKSGTSGATLVHGNNDGSRCDIHSGSSDANPSCDP